MNVKTTIPISEARRRLFEISDEVQTPGNHYTLTEKGRPKLVIVSAEEFESWQETLEVIKDFPKLKEDVKRAEREYGRGDFITLQDLLEKEGFTLNRENGLSSHHSPKSPKRARKDR